MKMRTQKQSDIMKYNKALTEMQKKMRGVFNEELPRALMIGYDHKIEEYYNEFIPKIDAAEFEMDKMALREELEQKIRNDYIQVMERRKLATTK